MRTLHRWASFSAALSLKRHIAPMSGLCLASGMAAACTFAAQVILARSLAPSQFGAFTSALATVMLVAPVAGFGLSSYWLRIFGEEGGAGIRWLASSCRFIAFSTLLALVLLAAWVRIAPHDDQTATLLILLSVTIVSQMSIELVSAKNQIEGRHLHVALWQFAQPTLRVAGLLALMAVLGFGAGTAVQAAVVFAAVGLCICILSLREVQKMTSADFRPAGHADTVFKVSQELQEPGVQCVVNGVWPFGLAGILYLLYYQSGIIFVKYIVGDAAAGQYSAAFSLIAAAYLLPSVIYQKFLLPKMHRWAYHDPPRLTLVERHGSMLMLCIGIFAAIILYAVAPLIITVVFGVRFEPAIPLLRILALGVPFTFVAASVGAILATGNSIGLKVKLMSVVAACNVIFNAFLIPRNGASGAAVANVVSQAVLCLLYVYFSKRQQAYGSNI